MNIRKLVTRLVIGAVIGGSLILYPILRPEAVLNTGSASDYYLSTATSSPTQLFMVRVRANVYTAPDLASSKIGRLAAEQQVLAECALGPNGEWCKLTGPFDYLASSASTDPDAAQIATAFAAFNSNGASEAWVWGGCLGSGQDCR